MKTRWSRRWTNASAPMGGTPITFFEITTAAAFLAFACEPADYVLIEVGLGGRFDATNVIARPAVTAITPVSLDHQQFLGDTVGKIAFEKAGILKAGVPAVIAPQSAAAEDVIETHANAIGAPLYRFGQEMAGNSACGMVASAIAGGTATYSPPALTGRSASICQRRRLPSPVSNPCPVFRRAFARGAGVHRLGTSGLAGAAAAARQRHAGAADAGKCGTLARSAATRPLLAWRCPGAHKPRIGATDRFTSSSAC